MRSIWKWAIAVAIIAISLVAWFVAKVLRDEKAAKRSRADMIEATTAPRIDSEKKILEGLKKQAGLDEQVLRAAEKRVQDIKDQVAERHAQIGLDADEIAARLRTL